MKLIKTALIIALAAGIGTIAGGTVLVFLAIFLGKRLFRTITQRLFGLVVNRVLSDKYPENLMELWSAIRRTSWQFILEISLRAQEGKIIKRPLGSAKKFLGFDGLMFVPAQMARLPLEDTVPVDMAVTLGPQAEKPLLVNIPLLISGMGFGVALSEESRLALAQAARTVGTAINSGEGPFLPEERQVADKYIWQIGRGSWGRDPQALAVADMIEVQMGQGARVGPHIMDPSTIKGKAQKLMRVSPVESARSGAVTPGVKSPWDWPQYVAELRQATRGKPIALKIMAGGRLEADLAVALEAGFDIIALDGAQGGTDGASPILEDDFGLPSLQALVRAVRYLREQGAEKRVSLIIGGGFFTPGECLKAIALGADAIYLGTVPLFALIHRQIEKVMPWEPLTRLVDYNSKYSPKLDIKLASQSVINVLNSMVMEMQEGIRALGKSSISEVGPNDLVALDAWTAEVTGIKQA